MRTTLVLDDALFERAREYSVSKTNRGVVHEALEFFQIKAQQGIRKLRGKLQWAGDLNELRKDRHSR